MGRACSWRGAAAGETRRSLETWHVLFRSCSVEFTGQTAAPRRRSGPAAARAACPHSSIHLEASRTSRPGGATPACRQSSQPPAAASPARSGESHVSRRIQHHSWSSARCRANQARAPGSCHIRRTITSQRGKPKPSPHSEGKSRPCSQGGTSPPSHAGAGCARAFWRYSGSASASGMSGRKTSVRVSIDTQRPDSSTTGKRCTRLRARSSVAGHQRQLPRGRTVAA